MQEILKQVPLDNSIKRGISSGKGELGQLLQEVITFEEAGGYSLQQSTLGQQFFEVAYRHSLRWAEQAMAALSEASV